MATSAEPATSIAVSTTFPFARVQVELLQKYRTAPVGSQGPWDASPPTVRHANSEKVVFRPDYERFGDGSGQRERCRSAARRQRGSWRQRTTRTWPVFTA